jgi:TonB family protein
MDQAIQIAIGKYPGTVTVCSLVGEHWDATESKPLEIFYHVVIVSPDDPKILATHVWVSATDGQIIKSEKEEKREEKNERETREPISGGILNGHAISLPKPEYPAIARAAGAEGTVTVAVVIDEQGNVISAKAVFGHPLLQSAAVNASREAKFAPTRLQGEPVRVKGMITYNFVKQ